jgi:hypothetical protein
MGSVYKINEAVYGASIIENLDLSTPMQNKISLSGLTLAETRGVISNT